MEKVQWNSINKKGKWTNIRKMKNHPPSPITEWYATFRISLPISVVLAASTSATGYSLSQQPRRRQRKRPQKLKTDLKLHLDGKWSRDVSKVTNVLESVFITFQKVCHFETLSTDDRKIVRPMTKHPFTSDEQISIWIQIYNQTKIARK